MGLMDLLVGTTPSFKILADGLDVTAGVNSRLLDLTIKDDAGRESDTFSLTLDDKDGILALPRDGAIFMIWLGYLETGLHFMGRYTADEVSSEGGDSGLTLKVSGKSADMRETLKERRSKHYDKKNLGDIFKAEAAEHGLQAQIAPELASVMREYTLLDNISLLHFGEQMARKYDAVFKIANGRLIFTPRQSGKSSSGQQTPVITATRPGNLLEWSVKPRIGRPRYGEVKAEWYDKDKAKRVVESFASGEGPVHTMRHLHRDRAEARAAAKSQSREQDRNKAGGSITLIGTPTAMAESKVVVAGTRPGVDGDWFGKSVEHKLGNDGFQTTVQIEPKVSK